MLVDWRYVLILSFGHLCEFKVTLRNRLHSLLSKREILELLYFLIGGIIFELAHSIFSLIILISFYICDQCRQFKFGLYPKPVFSKGWFFLTIISTRPSPFLFFFQTVACQECVFKKKDCLPMQWFLKVCLWLKKHNPHLRLMRFIWSNVCYLHAFKYHKRNLGICKHAKINFNRNRITKHRPIWRPRKQCDIMYNLHYLLYVWF